MALIKCPECSGTVSTTASACPHCGAPVAGASSPNGKHQGGVLGDGRCESGADESAARTTSSEPVTQTDSDSRGKTFVIRLFPRLRHFAHVSREILGTAFGFFVSVAVFSVVLGGGLNYLGLPLLANVVMWGALVVLSAGLD